MQRPLFMIKHLPWVKFFLLQKENWWIAVHENTNWVYFFSNQILYKWKGSIQWHHVVCFAFLALFFLKGRLHFFD